MLLGKHILPISTDGQLALPLDYRPDLSGDVIFCTQGLDHNVLLLTKSAFEIMYLQVKSNSITDPLARLLNRVIMGNAVEMKTGPEGGLQIPATLCEFAGLQEDVVLVGQGEYLELWSSSSWKKQVEMMQDHSKNTHRFEKLNVSLA
jgi:transcriptional regulator MraZ